MFSTLNPFNYSLAELQKTIIAGIGLVAYAASLFFFVDPGLVTAIVALVPPVFTVIGVFMKPNHTGDEFNKAFVALLGAAFTTATYLSINIDVSTQNKLLTMAGTAAVLLGVVFKGNKPIGSSLKAQLRLPQPALERVKALQASPA